MSLTPKQNPFGDTSSWPGLVSVLRAELASAQERIAKLECQLGTKLVAVVETCPETTIKGVEFVEVNDFIVELRAAQDALSEAGEV